MASAPDSAALTGRATQAMHGVKTMLRSVKVRRLLGARLLHECDQERMDLKKVACQHCQQASSHAKPPRGWAVDIWAQLIRVVHNATTAPVSIPQLTRAQAGQVAAGAIKDARKGAGSGYLGEKLRAFRTFGRHGRLCRTFNRLTCKQCLPLWAMPCGKGQGMLRVPLLGWDRARGEIALGQSSLTWLVQLVAMASSLPAH